MGSLRFCDSVILCEQLLQVTSALFLLGRCFCINPEEELCRHSCTSCTLHADHENLC